MQSQATEDRLREHFKKLGIGRLSRQEFKPLLAALVPALTEIDVETIFNELFCEESASINTEKFLQWTFGNKVAEVSTNDCSLKSLDRNTDTPYHCGGETVPPSIQDAKVLGSASTSLESGQWGNAGDEIRVWASSMRLNGAFPSHKCLEELLYGDPRNSARGADVIAIHFTSLYLNQEIAGKMKWLLRSSLENPDDYIFNEDDKCLGIMGIPVEFMGIDDKGHSVYRGLYICVHQRLVGDTDGNAHVEFQDVFPNPPEVTCSAPVDGRKSQDEYIHSEALVKQVAMLKVPFGGGKLGHLHLVIIGAELSESFATQQFQLLRLKRQLDEMRKLHDVAHSAFSAIFIGNTCHRIVATEDFKDLIEKEEPTGKEGKDKKSKKKKIKGEKGRQGEIKVKDMVEMADMVEMTDKLEMNSAKPKVRLNASGVEEICRRLQDPLKRKEFFQSSSLYFTGRDCFGIMHESPPECSQILLNMFELGNDWMLGEGSVVPLPTSTHTSLETTWSSLLGFKVILPEVVTAQMIKLGSDSLFFSLPNSAEDLQETYFPTSQPQGKEHPRVLKTNLGDPLYLQIGWLDGLGVYKNGTCPASIKSWSVHEDIYCFDHVPVKGSVQLTPDFFEPLNIWVGTAKLDNRYPSQDVLREFLYGTPGNSAKGADVIALCMTDIHIEKKFVKDLQNLLFKTLLEEEREQYIFNEQEEALTLKALPVVLMKVSNEAPRYNGLFICAKACLCGDLDGDGILGEVQDIFPSAPKLICRSDMKNESAPSFKGHLAQEVVLNCNGTDLHLLLVGTNFETEDSARLRQVERLERHIQGFKRTRSNFTVVLFGDFNNRLVCPEWLANHVNWNGEGSFTKEPVLSNSGALELCKRLAEDSTSIAQSLDSWFFTGKDAAGTELTVPEACRKLRDLFQLHIDLPFDPGSFPKPTYKRVPIGESLSTSMGFEIRIGELVLTHQVQKGIKQLKDIILRRKSTLQKSKTSDWGGAVSLHRKNSQEKKSRWSKLLEHKLNTTADTTAEFLRVAKNIVNDADLQLLFFGDETSHQREVRLIEDGCLADCIHHAHKRLPEDHVINSNNPIVKEVWPIIDCGWPDVVGVLRNSVIVKTEILICTPCETISGSMNHFPIRSRLRISLGQ